MGVKSGITYVISHNYAKITVDSLILHNVIILIKSVFRKDKNNYNYLKVKIIQKFLYKLYMLNFVRINVSEGSDVNNKRRSKDCDICHYWYFLDERLKFQQHVFNGYHDALMMFLNLSDIVILNIHGAGYRCIISLISKSQAVNLLQIADLNQKSGTL